jgi:hypothetical protein
MRINITIMQPAGYVHSLGFLESARYLRHHFGRLGADVSLTKNIALPRCLNILLGAHLGLPEGWGDRHHGVVFNQEQLGLGGASLPAEYLSLLHRSHVIDYDPANLAALRQSEGAPNTLLRMTLPLLNAPFLATTGADLPLEQRPIELLFFGSMNEQRARLIERIERCGRQVVRFDRPLYGPERDEIIAQSRAVLNIPFYGTNRFERIRAFNALSIGTPVVSLRRPGLDVEAEYEDAVQWFTSEQTELYFTSLFPTAAWAEDSRHRLRRWQDTDAGPAFAQALATLAHLSFPADDADSATASLTPPWIQLGSAFGYQSGWSRPDDAPKTSSKPAAQAVLIVHVASEVERLRAALSRAGQHLSDEGYAVIEWPLGSFEATGQDDERARRMAQSQMQLALELDHHHGTGRHRYDLVDLQWETRRGLAGSPSAAALTIGRFTLRRRSMTPFEMMDRRTARNDFGGLPEENVPGLDESAGTRQGARANAQIHQIPATEAETAT